MTNARTLWRRWLWGIGLFALFLLVAWRLQNLAVLLILSFLMAYVLNPVVTRLERLRYVNRALATLITLFGLLVCFLAILFVIVPEVVVEFKSFASRMPEYMERFKASVLPWARERFDFELPLSMGDAVERFGREIKNLAPKVIGPATNVVAVIFGGTFSVVSKVVAVLMFPFFLFFLLKDFPLVVGAVDDLIPPSSKQGIHQLAREVDASVSAFLHGQFIVMLVLGTLYSIGYSIVGIPVALGIGLLTGVLCFIPYVGAAIGFVLAITLSLLEFKGLGVVVGVVIVFGAVQLLDAILITPRIIGGQLGLKPLWIIIALMAGGELFGFLGVLLAVPTTAVLKVLLAHTIERYKSSVLYRDSAEFSSRPPDDLPGPGVEDASR